MSLVVSPSTGELIKVGSKEFDELLHSPVWGSHFTSPLTPMMVGTIKTVGTLPSSPVGALPPLPIVSTMPVLSPMVPISGYGSFYRPTLGALKPLGSLGALKPLGSVKPLGPLNPLRTLKPLNGSNPSVPAYSPTLIRLPNIPNIPTNNLTMVGLPQVPTSPIGSQSLQPVIQSYKQHHTKHNTTKHYIKPLTRSMNSLIPVPSSPSVLSRSSVLLSPMSPILLSPMSPVLLSRSSVPSVLLSPMSSLSPVPSCNSYVKSKNNNTKSYSSTMSPMSPMSTLSPVPSFSVSSPVSSPISSPVSSPMYGLPPVPSTRYY